jgi:chromosome partitioning protein
VATLIALAAADLLIIPTQPEYFSAWSLRSMTNMIREVRMQNNHTLAYRILITMFDRRNRVHRNVSEQIQAAFCECLFNTVINTDTRLRECERHGLPITHYDPSSRSTLQYQSVAQELIDYVENRLST